MLRKLFLLGLVCAFLAPTNAFAEKGKWSITPYGGTSYIARDMVNFDSATLTTTAKVFSDFTAFTVGGVATTAGDLRFDETHNTPAVAGFDVGYSLPDGVFGDPALDDVEVFGGFEYVTASGQQARALLVTTGFTFRDRANASTNVAPGSSIDMKLDDYNSWSIKVGATKYFPTPWVTPYIGGYGGFKHVDKMNVKLQIFVLAGGAAINSSKIKFYKATDTGFFGFHTGINKNFDMGGGFASHVGVRLKADYSPELTGDDSDVGEAAITGAGNTNDAGNGWDIGLTAHLGILF